jgi:hypothetical protein
VLGEAYDRSNNSVVGKEYRLARKTQNGDIREVLVVQQDGPDCSPGDDAAVENTGQGATVVSCSPRMRP